MDIIQADLLPELSNERKGERRDSTKVVEDQKGDQAAPLEHTTLDEYAEIAKEESTAAQRAKWQRELQEEARAAEKLRDLRTSTGYDGG